MSTWNDFTSAALIGLERAKPPALPAPLAPFAAPAEAAPEIQFLAQAAALALWRRAGRMLPPGEGIPEGAGEESRPLVRPESDTHLRVLLVGEYRTLLPEWLAEVHRQGWRVSPRFLPALLDWAAKGKEGPAFLPGLAGSGLRDRPRSELVLQAGGERALWLQRQNPDWSDLAAPPGDAWETGTPTQRTVAFRSLRSGNPDEARRKLSAVWATEPASVRSALLEEFSAGLTLADEDFLEAALDDRSKDVRRAAVDLLSRLPESRLVGRMIARAAGVLAFKRGGLLSRSALEVNLPGESDATAKRDGLDAKALGAQTVLGERAALLLLLLASIPPGSWTTQLGQSAADLIAAADRHEFATALITGWTWAATRFRETAWAEPLLNANTPSLGSYAPGSALIPLLPPAARVARLSARMEQEGLLSRDQGMAGSLVGALLDFPGDWPRELNAKVLAGLNALAVNAHLANARPFIEPLLLRVPRALLAESLRLLQAAPPDAAALRDFLSFRLEILQALSSLPSNP